MPRLMLLRHAAAAQAVDGVADRERRLTEVGRREAAGIGALLRERGEPIAGVLCSTARRTRETWSEVAAALEIAPRATFAEALYDADGDYIDVIAAQAGDASSLLVVGHNPATQVTAMRLAASLASPDGVAMSRGFPTAGLAFLDADRPWRDLAPGTMRLAAFVTPG